MCCHYKQLLAKYGKLETDQYLEITHINQEFLYKFLTSASFMTVRTTPPLKVLVHFSKTFLIRIQVLLCWIRPMIHLI